MTAPERQLASPSVESAHALAFGRTAHIEAGGGTVEIASPEGLVELSVRVTAQGCVLQFTSARLALTMPGRLQLCCEELVLQAQQRLELSCAGDFASRIGGNSTTQVSGRVEAEADELFLRTRRGDALIQANDYVRLVGEKVLLNSEQERRPARDQLEAFWRGLGL